MKPILNFWNQLTSGQKLFVVLVIAVIVWVMWNKWKGAAKAAGKNIQNSSEINTLASHGIKASYSESEYKSLATKLFNAMDGYGTDESAVNSVFFKLKNDADFIELDKAFGVREATDNLFGFSEAQDLKGWIVDDLDETEIEKLNNQLKLRGISKRF